MATNNNNNYKEYTVKVYSNKTEWYLNGNCHREDGPAVEWADGTKHWYLNGNRHRENGPAIEYANGTKHWYLDGTKYIESEWKKEIAKIKMKNSCNGKIVEIDGKKYKLIEEK